MVHLTPTPEKIAAAEATAALHKRGFPPGTPRWLKKHYHDRAKKAAIRQAVPGFRYGSQLKPFVHMGEGRNSNRRDHARSVPAVVGHVRGVNVDGTPRITFRLNPEASGPPLPPHALLALATKNARARQTHPRKRR